MCICSERYALPAMVYIRLAGVLYVQIFDYTGESECDAPTGRSAYQPANILAYMLLYKKSFPASGGKYIPRLMLLPRLK